MGVERRGEVQGDVLEDEVSPGWEEMGCWLLPKEIAAFLPS